MIRRCGCGYYGVKELMVTGGVRPGVITGGGRGGR